MDAAATLREGWTRARLRLDRDRRRRQRLHERFVREYGLEVRAGPFAGMRYPRQATKWVYGLVPRLLGTYECELHAVIGEVVASRYDTIVDVGSADGYYATGLAMTSPGSAVHAFEPVPGLRRFAAKVAALNGVADRITRHGACDGRGLSRLSNGGRTFVKIDCEGCEVQLLSAADAALLARAELLVELHDSGRGDPAAWLRARFAETHELQMLAGGAREPAAHPELALFDDAEAASLISESRGETMWWARLRPRARV